MEIYNDTYTSGENAWQQPTRLIICKIKSWSYFHADRKIINQRPQVQRSAEHGR